MNIYQTIAAVMEDIGAVGKTSKNQQQGFMFRSIDAVMNAINPALTKHKCFVVPEIIDQQREERQTAKGGTLIYSICTIRYTFYAEDGSSISAVVIGEAMDSGDKATNKSMSIAFRYACCQVFCIPTVEMSESDPDNTTPEPVNPLSPLTVELLNLLKATGVGKKSMLNSYGVKNIEDMLDNQKEEAIQKLRAMKEKMVNAGNRKQGPANSDGNAVAAQASAG